MGCDSQSNQKESDEVSMKEVVYNLDIEKVQEKVFSIFVEFDRICRKYGLQYSMEGGTLIGAVKFGGFVPWDDDVDVVMRREDYERFLQIAPREAKPEFFLESYNNVSQFPLNYAKFCLKSTKILNYAYSHLTEMHHGVFIDIFPIDNVSPKTCKLQCALAGVFTTVRGLKLRVTRRKGAKVFVQKLLSYLPIKWINGMIQFFCTVNNGKTTSLRYEVCNPNKKFAPLPSKLYDEYTELEFRGKKFLAVKEYNQFLKSRFGDNYMNEMPPEELRYPSHGYEIEFEENR